ncbi:TPA: hypothetical protein DEP21_04175 [Patescibacteria group bacterium]|nr:hypothetical protein [Candidatus Gracilibacteria bacterium]
MVSVDKFTCISFPVEVSEEEMFQEPVVSTHTRVMSTGKFHHVLSKRALSVFQNFFQKNNHLFHSIASYFLRVFSKASVSILFIGMILPDRYSFRLFELLFFVFFVEMSCSFLLSIFSLIFNNSVFDRFLFDSFLFIVHVFIVPVFVVLLDSSFLIIDGSIEFVRVFPVVVFQEILSQEILSQELVSID